MECPHAELQAGNQCGGARQQVGVDGGGIYCQRLKSVEVFFQCGYLFGCYGGKQRIARGVCGFAGGAEVGTILLGKGRLLTLRGVLAQASTQRVAGRCKAFLQGAVSRLGHVIPLGQLVVELRLTQGADNFHGQGFDRLAEADRLGQVGSLLRPGIMGALQVFLAIFEDGLVLVLDLLAQLFQQGDVADVLCRGKAHGVVARMGGDVQQSLFVQREFGAKALECGQARLVTPAVVQDCQQNGFVRDSLHQGDALGGIQSARRCAGQYAAVLHKRGVLNFIIGLLAQRIQGIQRRDVGNGRQAHSALRVLAGQLGEDAGRFGHISVGGIGRVLEFRDGCQAYGWVFVLPLLAL